MCKSVVSNYFVALVYFGPTFPLPKIFSISGFNHLASPIFWFGGLFALDGSGRSRFITLLLFFGNLALAYNRNKNYLFKMK